MKVPGLGLESGQGSNPHPHRHCVWFLTSWAIMGMPLFAFKCWALFSTMVLDNFSELHFPPMKEFHYPLNPMGRTCPDNGLFCLSVNSVLPPHSSRLHMGCRTVILTFRPGWVGCRHWPHLPEYSLGREQSPLPSLHPAIGLLLIACSALSRLCLSSILWLAWYWIRALSRSDVWHIWKKEVLRRVWGLRGRVPESDCWVPTSSVLLGRDCCCNAHCQIE